MPPRAVFLCVFALVLTAGVLPASSQQGREINTCQDSTFAVLQTINQTLIGLQDALMDSITTSFDRIAKSQRQVQASQSRIVQLLERLTSAATSPAKSCPAQWTALPGGACVAVRQKWVPWLSADNTCRAIGGRLFVFRSPDEVQAVMDFAVKRRAALWVGHRYDKAGVALTPSGRSSFHPPRSSYYAWDRQWSGECTAVDGIGGNRFLNSISCFAHWPPLCRQF